MAGFIFGGNTGVSSPQELARKRAVAEAIAASRGTPKNVGEGLNAIGQAIMYRQLMGQAAAGEKAGLESGNAAMAPLLAALVGGGSTPSVSPETGGAGSSSAAVPMPMIDYPSERVAQAHGSAAPSASPAEWLRYANKGATRDQEISPKLAEALGFLPDLGVTMEVFSGGQPAKGTSSRRVGSTRHDHGNAADVFFYKDGRRLDWANDADRPIFEEIVRRGKAAGVTGFGAGQGYMQPGSMHIGFGPPAVWGAGGSGANAPEWLRSAYNATGVPSPTRGPGLAALTNPALRGDAGAQPFTGPVSRENIPVPASGFGQVYGNTPMASEIPQQQPVQMAQVSQPAPMQPPRGPAMEAILGALNNQWAMQNPANAAIVKALLDREMQNADPMRQLQMQKMQQEIAGGNRQALVNAGKGRLYDPNNGQWLTAPDMGVDAPTTREFYDQETGQAYIGQWNPRTSTWERVGGNKAPSGMSLRTNPDGTVELVQGSGAGQKLTEGQSKDVGFYTRGLDANAQLDQMDKELADWGQKNAELLPLGVGNYLRSPEFRQAKQAADNFLAVILRKDTGAAVTPQEFDMYGKMFLPLPGDDPATIEQKRRTRGVALLGIKSGLGTAEAIAEANRLTLGLPAPGAGQPAGPAAPQKPIADMTEDELEAIINGQP